MTAIGHATNPGTPAGSRAEVARLRRPRTVALWLLLCCAMILAMVVIGGITRLTESGLSITRWQPVEGILPPLSDAAWQQAFADYRQTPEYREVNAGMSLEQFQAIYWWEYVHRLWGRLIGLVFAVPLLVLALRRRIPAWTRPHLVGLFALGALQGAIGWWMVQSGLVDRTDVSQYRLTVHLVMALAIFAYMLWVALRLLRGDGAAGGGEAVPRFHLIGFSVLIVLTLCWGGLTAGTNAGWLYNEFPLMGGRLVPADFGALDPAWLNLVENPGAIQWVHRLLATLTVLVGLALAVRLWSGRCGPAAVRAAGLLGLALLVQYGLGVATLLSVVELPLAVLHQAMAVLVVAATVGVWHACLASRPGDARLV
ncbi:MAG: COX15/CtaA family protein [Alphaproteobacteria bacterium]